MVVIYRKAKAPAKRTSKSALTPIVLDQICKAGLPKPVLEYHFMPPRKWRFDLAWPEWKVYLEIEGGVFMRPVRHVDGCLVTAISKRTGRRYTVRAGGGHNTGPGYEKNLEKYNAAAVLGWRGLRYTTDMIQTWKFLDDLREVLL